MKRRRRILLLLALAVVASAAGLALFWPRGPKEPVYQGKPLSRWLHEANGQSGDPKEYKAACAAVLAIGTNAVPYLLYQYDRPVSKWRSSFNHWAFKHPTIRFRFATGEEKVEEARRGFRLLGPLAAPALPKLAEYLGQKDRGHDAAWVMADMEEAALPYFLEACDSTNALAIPHAARGLVKLMAYTPSAITAVVQLLSHTNWGVRFNVAFDLNASHDNPVLLSALIKALDDPDNRVRWAAAQSLPNQGAGTKDAVPALLRQMTSSDRDLRRAASNAVFRIDPTALPPRGP